MPKQILISGIQPSGKLHIGNYLGMLKNAVTLQNSGKYRCFYFIADYHALTQHYQPKEKSQEIFKMAVDALAAGLDPQKSAIFIQSHILEHANLAWIFNTITQEGRLRGMIEYKEKISEGHSANMGLLDYPVLMAADILLYDADFVPVGEDQKQHLELARDTARAFNKRFGKTFKEPKAILTKAPRVMSLNNPNKKMSKSSPNGCLFLSDSPKIIRRKIMTAVTDSLHGVDYDPKNRPGVSNLVLIYSELSGKPIPQIVQKFKNAGYKEFKEELAEVVIKALKPFQQKQEELLKNKSYVTKTLADGAKTARIIAAKKLGEIKKKVGLI